MAALTLADNETRLLQEIVALCTPEHPGDEALLDLLGDVEALLGCEGVSLQRMDSVERGAAFFATTECGDRWAATAGEREVGLVHDPEFGPFWQHYWQSPCCLPERAGRPVVTSATVMFSEAQWRRHPMSTEVFGPHGVSDHLLVSYPERPGVTLRLIARRCSGAVFGERERFLMTLLQPHVRDLLVACSRPPVQAPVPALTQRQREILRLVQMGRSNTQIGRALQISEGTVRKHLEHIYTRLNVQSRTAAVGRAFFGEGAQHS